MKNRLFAVSMLLLSAVALGACSLIVPPEAASGEIEAVPIEVEEEPAAPEPDVEATLEEQTPMEEDVDEMSEAPAADGLTVFVIDQAGSEVRFELDEDLRGNRITVVGTTDQVAGELAFDLADLSTAQVGVITINARTLATDNDFRNRALRGEILDTNTYEFITFTPTAIEGLPATASAGEALSFNIVGDLTIRDVTQTVTFAAEATFDAAGAVVGSASTIIARGDYNLTIPSVPNVANVEEEVELYINFTALPK